MEYHPKERRLEPIPKPSRKSRLEAYVYDTENQETLLHLAANFITETPIHPYGVLIPVAAHQEAGRIARSMDEYAAQVGADPTTIFLYLNYPMLTASVSEVKKCIAEVETAKQKHPNLDIRHAVQGYYEPTIGTIRKDLWDTVAYIALHDGIYDTADGEFIGINHDIDTDRISPHYLRNIQQYYKARQQELNGKNEPQAVMESRFTKVKHGYDFDTYPNISRAALWEDFVYRQAARNGSYEEGLVVPMTHYALAGGFDSEARTHETKYLVPKTSEGIPGTSMDTSLRRYVSRFGDHGYSELWTDASFGPNDDCRVDATSEDISAETLEYHIDNTLIEHIQLIEKRVPKVTWDALVNERSLSFLRRRGAMTDEELNLRIERLLRPQHRLGAAVLRRVMELPILADLVDNDDTVAVAVKIHADWVNSRAEARALFAGGTALINYTDGYEEQ